MYNIDIGLCRPRRNLAALDEGLVGIADGFRGPLEARVDEYPHADIVTSDFVTTTN